MNKYHIRFNHNHNNSGLVWRIFENGVEHLAKDLKISGEVFTEKTVENDIDKWNIACYGNIQWTDGVATITTTK